MVLSDGILLRPQGYCLFISGLSPLAGSRVKVVEECLIKATKGSVADFQSDCLNGHIGLQKNGGFLHPQLGEQLSEGFVRAASDDTNDLALAVAEFSGNFLQSDSAVIRLDENKHFSKFRFPV